MLSTLHRATAAHDFVQTMQIDLVDSHGQTELPQTTAVTGCLDAGEIDDFGLLAVRVRYFRHRDPRPESDQPIPANPLIQINAAPNVDSIGQYRIHKHLVIK